MVPEEAYDQPVRVEWKLIASLRADAPDISNVQLAARVRKTSIASPVKMKFRG